MTYIPFKAGYRVRAMVPWWMRHFVDPRSCYFEFSYPFNRAFFFVWFWPAKKMQDYNFGLCQNFVPDRVNYGGGLGRKVRPLFGYVFVIDEGAECHFAWWKHITKV